jgi:hypothetical protein
MELPACFATVNDGIETQQPESFGQTGQGGVGDEFRVGRHGDGVGVFLRSSMMGGAS